MTLSCSAHMQTAALDFLVTGIAGSTEQNTTRWVMTCLKVLEEVDAANPDGIALSLRWNSLEKDVSYTVSKVQRCLSSTIWCTHSDVAHKWEGGMSKVLLRVSCFSCNHDIS